MHRLAAAACAAGLTLTLAACGGKQSDPPPAPAAPASSAPEASAPEATPSTTQPTPTAAPTPDQGQSPDPNQTQPEKLDQALLAPDQMPGWQPAEAIDTHAETLVDPEPCTRLHELTIGKVASDMGATVAYDKDDQSFHEYLDIVDSGAASVGEVEQLVGQCPAFTMDDDGEKTPVKVARFDAPGLGERSVGVRVTLTGEAAVDRLLVFAGHKDVLMTTSLEAEKADPQAATALSRTAIDKVKKTI